jgi:hypothetical protein
MAKQKKCSSCKYSCRISCEGGDRFCQYILITGRRRPCPGGDECTAYEKGKWLKEYNFDD